MKFVEFIENFRSSIAKVVTAAYPPQYDPTVDVRLLPKLHRTPKGMQELAIRAAAESMSQRRGTTIVGEMGVGKTFMGIVAAYMAGWHRTLVLVPPHLVRKWKREVEDTLVDAHAVIVSSIHDLKKLQTLPYHNVFIIMSREKAKLTYRWCPAYREIYAIQDKNTFRDSDTGEPIKVMACPSCYKPLVDNDDVPLLAKNLERRRMTCSHCEAPLWQADPEGPRRISLAKYIAQYMPGFFDGLIADECHEYKGQSSAQGVAAGILADNCKHSLALSGTLTGGYASTLFFLLYRFHPGLRDIFEHDDLKKWVDMFGIQETVITTKETVSYDSDGRSSLRQSRRTQVREKPGLMPTVLSHVLNHSIFVRLSDVAHDLPSYTETVQVVKMDEHVFPTLELSQASAYRFLHRTLYKIVSQELSRGSKRLLSTYMHTLLAYPDGCTRGEQVTEPGSERVIIDVKPMPEDWMYPKEEALLKRIQEERKHERRVLVYVTHTDTRDITVRLQQIIEQAGIACQVLKSHTVSPDRREQWVKDRLNNGMEVMICHPRLVQTGLDLVEFPTLVWYETDYSVYTMRQASRRSWRIGQNLPVKVIYMTYEDTLQSNAIQLMARKMQSSLAVEGHISDDGLANYEDAGEDMMIALARTFVNQTEQVGDLQAMVDMVQSQTQQEEVLLVEGSYDLPTPLPEIEIFEEIPEEILEVEAETSLYEFAKKDLDLVQIPLF